MPEPLAIAVLALTAGVLALLLPFASHRTWLLFVARRRTPPPVADAWDDPLPRVTVQLPVFNERNVVERLVDAACRLDYPRERLQVQVLDDSTDATTARARRRVERWRERGVRVELLHRDDRAGFKAGALARGLEDTDGEFLLVLDADFVPPPDLLRRLLPAFADPEVGMVQARWDHLNREQSWLTRAQALLLDGHFFFEQGGRHAAGRFFNFNGTAGMWRRRCLEDAGGWEPDTLTEDLDLSYRAQMEGWRFVFLEDVGVPAEVPARAGALEVQQRRWAQGGIQTARKILPRLLRGPWSWPIKLEAVIHLCGHLAHPLTLLLGLLLYPSAVARRSLGMEDALLLDLAVFAAATVPFLLFYGAAGRRRGRSWGRLLPDVVRTVAVGVGLSAPVSRAVIRGLTGAPDPFVRTPKAGDGASGAPGVGGGASEARDATAPEESGTGAAGAGEDGPASYGGRSRAGDTALKLGLGALMIASGALALADGFYASLPFVTLFASGWLALGLSGLRGAAGPAADQGAGHEERQGRGPHRQAEPGRLGPDAGVLVGAQAPVAQEYEAA